MSRTLRNLSLAALVATATLIPAPARAQDQASAAPVSALIGPRVASAGVHFDRTASLAAPAPQDDMRNSGSNVAMMIVGGAALIVGLSVGGEGGQIIAVGGAVIGLIGLFRYLR